MEELMNNKVKKLFDLQTNIALNYVLISLLKFFLNPKATEVHLYDTMIPIRSITRAELRKAGKSIPNTFRYELWIKLSNGKLLFSLRAKNHSEIEIYNLILTVFPPTSATIKNITKILVTNYHPMPSKIDKEFSKLAKNYSDYLAHYALKRQWYNGYPKKRKNAQTTSHMSTNERNALYEEFFNDLSRLALEYRVLAKIVIDAYRSKDETLYMNTDHTYELRISFAKPFAISLTLNCLFENFNYYEIIPLNKFERNNKFFKKESTFYNVMLSCVDASLN